ncbi:hypothetical protein OG871_26460 [Kitasatospora sp. NBC_00374]
MRQRIPRWAWWAFGVTAVMLYLAADWADGVFEDETAGGQLGWYETSP